MLQADEDFPNERQKPLRRLQRGKPREVGSDAQDEISNELSEQLQGLILNRKSVGRFGAALAARKPIAGKDWITDAQDFAS